MYYILTISLPYLPNICVCVRLLQAVKLHLLHGARLVATLIHNTAMQSPCGKQRALCSNARHQGPAIGQRAIVQYVQQRLLLLLRIVEEVNCNAETDKEAQECDTVADTFAVADTDTDAARIRAWYSRAARFLVMSPANLPLQKP